VLEPITAVIAGTIVPIVDVAWSLWLVSLEIAPAP